MPESWPGKQTNWHNARQRKTTNCGPNATLIKKLIKKPAAKPTQKLTTMSTSSSEMNGVAKASCRMQSELDNAMLCVESELQCAKWASAWLSLRPKTITTLHCYCYSYFAICFSPQVRNAIFTTLNIVIITIIIIIIISLPYVICSSISKRDFHYTKTCFLLVCLKCNFSQFRNAIFTTLKCIVAYATNSPISKCDAHCTRMFVFIGVQSWCLWTVRAILYCLCTWFCKAAIFGSPRLTSFLVLTWIF